MQTPGTGPFRLGDVRGLYPNEIDEEFAYKFARAFVTHYEPQGKIATGRDMRPSGHTLQTALNRGFNEAGYDVVDLGLCTTELGYFASSRPGIAASVMVTASHNPLPYTGFKCALGGGEAVTFETGLADVQKLMRTSFHSNSYLKGSITGTDIHQDYVRFLASKFPVDAPSSRKIALNGLNGAAATIAGPMVDFLNLPVTWFRQTPGDFPLEGADPAHPALAREMKQLMTGGNFSLGVAWDGDADRCIFFDGDGNLTHTYYIVGILVDTYLRQYPGASIVYDTKLCWNTLEIIALNNGIGIPCETGHAFMKQKMRRYNAIYGGELSGHHYFADFYHCDSGMFAWLKMLEVLRDDDRTLAEMIDERRNHFCITPEITLKLTDPKQAFDEILSHYGSRANIDFFDGLSFDMDDWRFSLRHSKTEPVVRLNLESRAGADVLLNEGHNLLSHLQPFHCDEEDWTRFLYIH